LTLNVSSVFIAFIKGAILIASGRVPNINNTFLGEIIFSMVGCPI
jgi:hypothetical protein